ncbi:isochorismatase family protein [Orrella daihaiensis]|uniref:Isochorismatase family protein n=1 Tax=Orrella daihaiensis TaxID=2782176 RepID=A0ABY4ALX3_9BURK|nr:isochorismatase family protein [Orrella daihaiensis]UOD51314.1 isochorismatase family protein [Orrella daihaiensis]
MIRRLSAAHSVLLIVDMQASLMPVIDQGDLRIAAAKRLADAAKLLNIPVLATEHLADKLGHTVEPLLSDLQAVCNKTHFDGTKEDHFEAFMPPGRSQVVVCGAEAHVCVMQTALGVLQSGREVWMASDACGSRHDEDRVLGLGRLANAGAELVSSEMVMFEWLVHADHPKFRDVLAVIKSKDG